MDKKNKNISFDENTDANSRHILESSNPSFASAIIDEIPSDLEKERGKIDTQLGSRPTFSIRVKIVLAFSVIFILCGIITFWTIYVLAEFEAKIDFLELSGNYLSEIQEARRVEKNYFLYNSKLDEGFRHLANAKKILVEEADTIMKIVDRENYQKKLDHFLKYESLLKELRNIDNVGDKKEIESSLRRHGSNIVEFANDFVVKERAEIGKMFKLSRRIPFYFLAVLLVLMFVTGTFFARNLLGTLARFMKYTERIGKGDFSPIAPARKYQDEFSHLAKAINHMIGELDHRHKILVASHKLRAIGTLVSGVAHELNNPLNNTMLTASALAEDMETLSNEDRLEMTNDIIGETERAQRIVRNLLDFARESKASVKPLAIDEIIEGSIRLVANQIRLSKIRLETDYSRDLPTIHGDEQMLKQVFVNLILNAVDALPPKGSIFISVNRSSKDGKEDYLEIDIKDNGPGISEHVLDQIFDPFFTTKTKGKGTGLGLSVSQGIVRKLGGYINAKSVVGSGTTFTVFLPATNVPFSVESKQDESP